MPVAEPLSGAWEELRTALKQMWVQTTQCSNWMMTQLYTGDVRRDGQEKMPSMPHQYLYPEARRQFPNLTPQSVASLEQAIQRKYRKRRYEVVWTAGASLPTCRYPQPFPIHNQSWSIGFDSGNRPVFSGRIGGKRWELRLRGGLRYRRQVAAIRQMVDGSAIRGEAAILRHNDGQILCKMVAWLPRQDRTGEQSGELHVRTCADKLLVAVDPERDRPWIYNGDHLRRWIQEYDRKRQRLAEDQKAEQRPVPTFAGRRANLVEKYRRRLNTAIQQIAASLANFAHRYKIVVYDDSVTGFLPPRPDGAASFPWFQLREAIRTKLDEYGVRLEHASGQTQKEPQEPLAKE
jgi:hypothetical protein